MDHGGMQAYQKRRPVNPSFLPPSPSRCGATRGPWIQRRGVAAVREKAFETSALEFCMRRRVLVLQRGYFSGWPGATNTDRVGLSGDRGDPLSVSITCRPTPRS